VNLQHPPERLDALAREYALGQLTGGAQRRFEREMQRSQAVREAVWAWEGRLATLATSVPPLAPRPAAWQSIEQRLFSSTAAASSADGSKRPGWWSGWLGRRAFGGALAGMLLSAVVLREQPGLLGLEPAADGLPASYVGLLQDADGRAVVLASSRRHGRSLSVKLLQRLSPPAGRQGVLWALPKDGSAPFAIDRVVSEGSATVALRADAETLFFNVDRLALSYESDSGALPEQPTQPYAAIGPCAKLW